MSTLICSGVCYVPPDEYKVSGHKATPSLTDILEYNPGQLHGYANGNVQIGGLLLAVRSQ